MKSFLTRSSIRWAFLSVALLQIRADGLNAQTTTSMESFVRQYTADENGVSRFYDLQWSDSRFDRLGRVYDDWWQRLYSLNFDGLDQQGRIDYLLLRNKLTEEQAHLNLEKRWLGEMDSLLPFRKGIQELDLARRITSPVKSQADAEILSTLPEEIKKLRGRIEKTKSDKGEKAEKSSEKAKTSSESKEKEKEAKTNAPAIKVSPVLAKRTAEAVDLRRLQRREHLRAAGFKRVGFVLGHGTERNRIFAQYSSNVA